MDIFSKRTSVQACPFRHCLGAHFHIQLSQRCGISRYFFGASTLCKGWASALAALSFLVRVFVASPVDLSSRGLDLESVGQESYFPRGHLAGAVDFGAVEHA